MATESSTAVSLFRAGGVAHEKAEITTMAALVAGLFPGATSITIQVYFGEANLYATAVYSGGGPGHKPAGPPRRGNRSPARGLVPGGSRTPAAARPQAPRGNW